MAASSTSPLAETLRAAGQRTLALPTGDGGRLLLLERGARVIGLYPSNDDNNVLWTNPALATANGARAFFAAPGWTNPGGDRTWIAPEHALFFGEQPPTWEHYRVPPALDPGSFRLQRRGDTAGFHGDARLVVRGVRRRAEITLRKLVTPVANPLSRAIDEVCFAGYRSTTTLTASSSAPLALWQLLQLPHGGEMIVGTHGRATPRVLFGNVHRTDWSAGPRVLRHVMNASGNHKLGLTARQCTGRAGYVVRSAPREWSLVIRDWQVNPTGR